jgi:hypothetical protein
MGAIAKVKIDVNSGRERELSLEVIRRHFDELVAFEHAA